MFQSFDVVSRPAQAAPRIKALRGQFASLGINAVLVPKTDEYQGEYVPEYAERLAWLTGFTGSAGMALVMEDRAVVFVDGRYTTQVRAQVDPELFSVGDLVGCPAPDYLEKEKPKGVKLGIDPWLHTPNEVERLRRALATIGGELVLLAANPVDAIWDDQPEPPTAPVTVQGEELAGKSAADKIADIAAGLVGKNVDAVLISDSTSVAWLFNIRGNDVTHTPAPLSRAIVMKDGGASVFIASEKLSDEAKAHLEALATIEAPEAITGRLAEIAGAGETIALDKSSIPYAILQGIEGAGGPWVDSSDPVVLARAVKNEAEIAGSRAAHLQDGAAMVSFLCWLDEQLPGSVSEIDAVKTLEDARRRVGRRMQNPLCDISFDTISGAGPNAAIIHYRVTKETDRKLNGGEMYLVDSGGQYRNGTTDITRTIAVGGVSQEQRRFFTLVLKGMIALSTARFPVGSRGVDLDALARIALWKAGCDYAHGTGHGVGSYLSVHESPQRFSRAGMVKLEPGMIISNEPGYYRPEAFGIRIENLLLVREASAIDGGDMPMLGFETLTWCPVDTRLILPQLLTKDEVQWLNDYHTKTRERLMPLISDEGERSWLENVTRPL